MRKQLVAAFLAAALVPLRRVLLTAKNAELGGLVNNIKLTCGREGGRDRKEKSNANVGDVHDRIV
jgi:hypothetical protein